MNLKGKCNFYFVLMLAVIISGCQQPDKNLKSEILILDEANIMASAIRESIGGIDLPAGFPYIVRVIESVEKKRIATFADDQFYIDSKLHPDPLTFRKRGVYILVTHNPLLVQVRTGNDIGLMAQWSGITAGPGYIAIQQKAVDGDLIQSVAGFIKSTSEQLPEKTKLSGLKKYVFNDLTTFLVAELEAFSIPSESFYSRYLLKPVLQLRIIELTSTNSWWISYAFLFIISIFVAWAINRLVFGLIVPRVNVKIKNLGQMAVEFFTIATFTIPAIASTIVLSGARLEDRMVLMYSGLKNIDRLIFEATSFVTPTPWYLVMLATVLFLLKSILQKPDLLIMTNLSPVDQRKEYYKYKKHNPADFVMTQIELDTGRTHQEEKELHDAPYTYLLRKHAGRTLYFTFIIGLAAWFFLPKAFATAAIWFWLVVLLQGLVVFAIKAGENSSENYKGEENESNQNGNSEADSNSQDFNQILENYTNLINENPTDTKALYQRGVLCLKNNLIIQAEADFSEIIDIHKDVEHTPYFLPALSNKIRIGLKAGKFKDALSEAEQLVESAPIPVSFVLRASVKLKLEDYESAMDDINIALEKNPDFAEAFLMRGAIYAEIKNEIELACADFRKAQENGMGGNPELDQYIAKYCSK